MIRFGADYYPEQWPEERWAIDARLMQEAHFNTVRLAEFAWSKLEPVPGTFDFDWLDRAIDVLTQHDLQIVLGTPTASPPPWLMAKYPDLYLVQADGTTATYGGRREYCPTAPVYRAHSASITQAMADHYADHPHVIGWQIDNEFGDRCYCASCRARFQEWLKDKHGNLDALNEKWGTIFWSHTYTDWSQIPTPQKTATIHNPGLELDYMRFMSDTYQSFQQAQIDILRERCPSHFISHNLMGFGYDKLNYFDLAYDLDLVTWDNYPRGFWIDEFDINPSRLALAHATMYGLKDKPFWVMEAQSGAAGWTTIGPTPRPGEARLWAYQAIAHGADGIVFFRWRTARYGAEQYWHGILNHDGSVQRRYREVQQLGEELRRIGGDIVGTERQAKAAMLLSYDSRFALESQPNNAAFSYAGHFQSYFSALHRSNVPTAIVPPHADLSAYRLVIAPALYVLDETTANNLRRYVENGGVLVLTTRSGVKDVDNAIVNMPLPGLLAEICGLTIPDYDSLLVGHTRSIDFVDRSESVRATQWCDILELKGAEALACYNEDYYAGQPAVALNRWGRGSVIYVGTVGDASLVEGVVNKALALANLSPVWDTVDGVEVTTRSQNGRRLVFLLNHSNQEQTVTFDKAYGALLSPDQAAGRVVLPAKDVLILAEDAGM
jgi:beta-galactosidase